MLKMMYQTSVGTFDSLEKAFEFEWIGVCGGRRFLRMFDENGDETFNVKTAAYIVYRSEKAHQLVKDYLEICGWKEREDNTHKRGIVYGMGFMVECPTLSYNEIPGLRIRGDLAEMVEKLFNS